MNKNLNKFISTAITLSLITTSAPCFASNSIKRSFLDKCTGFIEEYAPLIISSTALATVLIWAAMSNRQSERQQKSMLPVVQHTIKLSYSSATIAASGEKFSGLQNVGNSCYLNAAIQQLYRIDSFRNDVLNADNLNNRPHVKALRTAFLAIANNKVIDMREIARKLGHNGRQEDSYEITQSIINFCTEEGIAPVPMLNPISLFDESEHPYNEGTSISTLLPDDKQKLPQDQFFIPVTRITANSKAVELDGTDKQKILELFEPMLQAVEKKNPPEEGNHRNVSVIVGNPELTYTIKRNGNPMFTLVSKRKNSLKLSVEDTFEHEGVTYQLSGVTIHHGNAIGGHYFTYQRKPDGNWCELNDATVQDVTYDAVSDDIATNGTMYVYKRVSSEPSAAAEASQASLSLQANLPHSPVDLSVST